MKKKSNTCLINKVCTPCQGGVPPLSDKEQLRLLLELGNGWAINNEGHLYKEYYFNNFIDAMSFTNILAELAEQEAHHPNIEVSWGKCAVSIWTHKIEGLTENDFILGAKIEAIA